MDTAEGRRASRAKPAHRRVAWRIVLWLVVLALVVTVAARSGHAHLAVLSPAGQIGMQERHLMYTALLLSVIVVVPVFIMLFGFAWRYRETNHRASYAPDLAGNRLAETIWWLVPLALIAILSVITWQSSHQLDPFRALTGSQPPMTVDVVALQWKWLFLYPAQGVATVNQLMLPTGTPVAFHITSDAPMNSFWIPQLGGQIYAMSGMSTELHLIANQPGVYRGLSANISGSGFASMTFSAHAMSPQAFTSWSATAKQGSGQLSMANYESLAQPSVITEPTTYASYNPTLFSYVLAKYMSPGSMAHMVGLGGVE